MNKHPTAEPIISPHPDQADRPVFPVISETAGVLWVPTISDSCLTSLVHSFILPLCRSFPSPAGLFCPTAVSLYHPVFEKVWEKMGGDVNFFWFLMIVTQQPEHLNHKTCLPTTLNKSSIWVLNDLLGLLHYFLRERESMKGKYLFKMLPIDCNNFFPKSLTILLVFTYREEENNHNDSLWNAKAKKALPWNTLCAFPTWLCPSPTKTIECHNRIKQVCREDGKQSPCWAHQVSRAVSCFSWRLAMTFSTPWVDLRHQAAIGFISKRARSS